MSEAKNAAIERWDCNTNQTVIDKNIDCFLRDIISVCKQHGYSIGHEDRHGGFAISRYNDAYSRWLQNAQIEKGCV